MNGVLELDEQRSVALQQAARHRKVSPRRLLAKAVDEFLQRQRDEELLESSARTAQRTSFGEEDKARRKLRQSWAGALAEYRDQYTSIELQKLALEWRTN